MDETDAMIEAFGEGDPMEELELNVNRHGQDDELIRRVKEGEDWNEDEDNWCNERYVANALGKSRRACNHTSMGRAKPKLEGKE